MNQQPGRKLEMNKPYGVHVERCNNGEPILSPGSNWWETGVTFNPAAFYLAPTPENQPVMRALLPMRPPGDPDLAEGVVAVHYRARPEQDPGSEFARSFIGLAVYTPDFRLIYRYQEPVLFPSADPNGYDALGVEDPRVHRFGDSFYMVYCGVEPHPTRNWHANLCLAVSPDMVQWEKRGVMPGELSRHNNKDGVLFPDPIDGKYWLLHRPFYEGLPHNEYSIDLASSDSLEGPWHDHGEVLRAFPNPRMRASWVGAGSVPVKIGPNRYLHIYHTGNYLNETDREYDLTAAIFDFNALDRADPRSLVTARLEPLMVPETPAELRSRSQLQVGNVLFACGSYEYKDWIYIIYGGADTYTLAARVNKSELLAALETSGLDNPF
jgi:beta-1,2-mannobiose phosphorylase / 1,2-beta-oligomannan phosphorylase